MMAEKLKERQEAAEGSEVPSPSPPQRHEKWKRARLKPSGEYTSEDARRVAEKIDSLVLEGTFVPQGRKDILTEATGYDEHPGRVRAVGRGVGIRQFFGSHSRKCSCPPPVMNKYQIETIKAELIKDIREQVMRDISSLPAFSQKSRNDPICSSDTTLQYASANGTCSEVPHIQDDDQEDIPEECELYIDGNTRVVAYANVYMLGPNIQNQVLNNDMVRVAVTKVMYANAKVPVPTDEVTTVGDASNTFIQWPKRLLQLTSKKKYDAPPKKSEPICKKLGVKAMFMDQTLKFNGEFGETNAIIELPREDIVDLCMGTKDLGITVLQVWLIQNERGSVQSYMQKKMCDDIKECYLAPYFSNHHWQLFIINPQKLEVAFLCSLGKKPDKKIYDIVKITLEAYNKLQRVRKQKKVEWFYPTTQIFRDSNPFQKEEVKNVQERCENMILEHIEASGDNDMNYVQFYVGCFTLVYAFSLNKSYLY
ncbi:uncharacterized protein LOC131598230 [Vicia villosa]|uniref:uncharacterized protein LOC131598230 n=1 Tax=Vicia villosa TaxID=3911 RepID=UPI00273AD178|nr:uncharacterized protein LOC131598230 [Vicia villosa]